MAFPRPSAAATALFDELLPDEPDVVRRPMFGHPAAFAGGRMFMGTFGDDVILRLDEKARAELLAEKGTALFEPMKGRPMREYVVVPRAWRDRVDVAREWVERSLAWVRKLPPKRPRAARAKKLSRG